ncbi:hypothetical protein [Corynebacterium sp. 321]|uniref:hypothetical protein n=1 Tax=Corynebacterium sp. 321 TaxID=2651047 RepID=UPI001300F6A5|nr:hypothetical protein [Corynebacterium sp. 321]KAB1552589.1 hypothetical protein F7233_02275 [Corynebacterium sp. 321]
MRQYITLYAVGHRGGRAFGLLVLAIVISIITGSTSIPLPWLSEGSLDLSVNHLLAVALLAAHITLLTGELSHREESGARSWWWADSLGQMVLLSAPVILALTGSAGLLQNTLLYLVLFFSLSLPLGPEIAYPAVIVLIVIQTMAVALVSNHERIPLFWAPDSRIIGVLFLLALVTFAMARRRIKIAR